MLFLVSDFSHIVIQVKNIIKSILNTAIPTSAKDLYIRKIIVKIELNIIKFFILKTTLSIKISLMLKNEYRINMIIRRKTEINPPLA